MDTKVISRESRSTELQDFLKEHRKRWCPVRDTHTAALTLKSRDGTGKWLTLEDLAELTGYAPETIKLFHRGGMRSPSLGFLAAVASALRLSLVDRKHLWHLATGAPPPMVADRHRMRADNPALAQEVHENYPRPSYLIDPAFRLLAYNDAVPAWLWDPRQHPELDDNMALWTLCHPHARHVYPHWADVVAPAMVARIRAIHAKLPADPHINHLISRLCAESECARRLWEEDSAVVEWPTACVVRTPGHTDPDQPDDQDHHVAARVVTLSSPAEGDERLLVTLSLPRPMRLLRPASSQQTCAACARVSVAATGQ